MKIDFADLSEFIRENNRLRNILNWEANRVSPRAWGPRLAIRHILENPKRRAKVQKELDKYAKSAGLEMADLDFSGADNPYVVALAEVIQDFRTKWELR